MDLIQATGQELNELLAFYELVADYMEKQGLQQWHWGRYPNEQMIREDIEKGDLYYMRMDGSVAAAVVLMAGQEPEYDSLRWTWGVRPGIFHRLGVHPSLQGAGLGGMVLDDVMQILRRMGCDCVRCDTSEKNEHALRLYEKHGFRRCGVIKWAGAVNRNITFDKPLKRETPLWPIPMKPAFRDGEKTPWGGTGLRDKFGKETKNDRTGESMEVSCIPGLESTDENGRKLPDRKAGNMGTGHRAVSRFSGLSKRILTPAESSQRMVPQRRKPSFSYSRRAFRFFSDVSQRTQSQPLRRSSSITSSSTRPPRPAPCMEGCTARRWKMPGRTPQDQGRLS